MIKACRAGDSEMVPCKSPSGQAQKMFIESINYLDRTVAYLNSTEDCVVAGPTV